MSLIERAGEKLKSQKPQSTGAEDAHSVATDSGSRGADDRQSTVEQFGARVLNDNLEPGEATNSLSPTVNVDIERAREYGLYPPESTLALVESEYRRVKRPLLARMTGRGAAQVGLGERIMVTSALENEGKTYTAFNLALSLSQEQDWEIVLIDCDTIRQSLTQLMDMEGSVGLLDVLASPTVSINDAMHRTNVPHLLFIPSGVRVPHAPELLSGNRMRAVLDLLSQHQNRIFVFDSPPLLGAPDSLAISEFVGQILFVVKAGSTQRQAVADGLQSIDKSKAIHFILNQVRSTSVSGYGNYEYSHYLND